MFDSIFKLTEVGIFIRNVLETKTLFLTLEWEIGIPSSEVEGTSVVP